MSGRIQDKFEYVFNVEDSETAVRCGRISFRDHEHDGDALAAAEAHPRAGRLQSPLRGSARQNHSGKERLLWLLYCGSRVHGQKVMGLNLAIYESTKNKFYASQNG